MEEESLSPKQKRLKYQEELDIDCSVDSITILQKLEDHPKIVNKWIKNFYDNSDMYNGLVAYRENTFAECQAELESNGDVRYQNLTRAAMERKINSYTKIKKIDKLLKEQKSLVDALEEMVNVTKYTFMDCCKAIVEIRKMEEMS